VLALHSFVSEKSLGDFNCLSWKLHLLEDGHSWRDPPTGKYDVSISTTTTTTTTTTATTAYLLKYGMIICKK